ncbi:terpene synthase family protein [Streptomyces monashensis]|uniref:Terpene synthase n=1 Tax=Streptomyces monashensis TaxID=1678012 RepID=A0A1S2QI33_9ACTN|nr:terpene cyclase [Streptomyces monashensis]OIK05297.1 terpene cyclase [Streptomyces monashensis]
MSALTRTGGAHIPEIHCPFPYQVNPHADQARAHLDGWVRRTGLVRRASAAQRFAQADFGWFVSLVHPTANARHLELTADWFAWLFLVDDQLDDGGFGRSPQRMRQLVDSMREVLEAADFGASRAPATDAPPAVSSLADLWRRTAADASPQWRRRFVRHLRGCLLTATVWEADNRIRGRVPDEETYIEKRRHTGAIYVCMDLIEIVEHIDVPEDLYDSPEFTAALDAACNVVCWTNDVYSLEKERALGEVHNLAYVVQHHRGIGQEQAVAEVCAATSAETERFLSAERNLLRTRLDHAAVLTPYLAGMRTWIRGNLDWSRRTRRYQPRTELTAQRPDEYLEPALTGAER